MTLLYITGSLIFIILHAFFAASEIAFISSSKLKLRHRIDRGDNKAQLAYSLISSPEKFLATTLVGTNISVVVSSSLATLFLIHLGVENSNFWITCLYTPLIVITGELVPKNIGRHYRENFSCFAAVMIKFFERIFYPLVALIEKLSILIIQMLMGKKKRASFFVTKEEIKMLLREVERGGELDRSEKEAIEDIFDFRKTKIKDVTTAVKNIIGLDYADSYEDVLQTIRQSKYTRYPVFQNKKIIGYVNVFDLCYEQKDNWLDLIRPITHVGANQKLYDIFSMLKKNKENMALVIRGKKNLGIVTLEDLIREIITSIIKYDD